MIVAGSSKKMLLDICILIQTILLLRAFLGIKTSQDFWALILQIVRSLINYLDMNGTGYLSVAPAALVTRLCVALELQIRRGDMAYLEIIVFLYLNKNIRCDPSFEPSR